MSLDKLLTEIRGRLDKATLSEWSYRESNDLGKTPYIFINPGYFFWPQFIENEVTKLLKVKSNAKDDAKLIAAAPSDLTKLLKIVEILREALKSNIDYSKMNTYPDHEVRHTLCCDVPQVSIDALSEADKLAADHE